MSQAQILLLTHRGLGEAFLVVTMHIFGSLPERLDALAPEGNDLDPLRQRLVERSRPAALARVDRPIRGVRPV